MGCQGFSEVFIAAVSCKAQTSSIESIRPTVIFGDEDILINNIAWLLRRFPIFPIFGPGRYRLQPIYVEDMADLVVNAGQIKDNRIIDASELKRHYH